MSDASSLPPSGAEEPDAGAPNQPPYGLTPGPPGYPTSPPGTPGVPTSPPGPPGYPPPGTIQGHDPRLDDRWGPRIKRALAPLAAIGAFFAKFGAILFKLKAFTVIGSMAVSIAAYASLWGWTFAAGFVGLIFVHEMGHVVALRRRGVKAGAPVFLPFLGAFVRMKESPRSVFVEAETALAGPYVGTAGAFVVLLVGNANGSAMLRDLAFTGFLLNLFNLLPVLPLDGGRAAAALHPALWAAGLVLLLAYEIYRPSPIIPIILILGGIEMYRRWRGRQTAESRAYQALTAQQRTQIGLAYLALIVTLLLAVHATYVRRSL
jgi:Zn-dependent protease